MTDCVEAFVLGRVCADLYPLQLATPLEEVKTFERFVGGFAGNVATGLARLGVRVAILSAVGDDGHGRFVRNFLASEGVDVRWLLVHPKLRTALAFCEAWPPDRFPITFYRTPTCPDWELRPEDLPLDEVAAAPLFYAGGTGLAVEPSRSATLAALKRRASVARRANSAGGRATVLDLDWRPILWDDAAGYGPQARRAAAFADILLGSDSEFAAAGIDPATACATLGVRLVVVKHGPAGATVVDGVGAHRVPGIPVPIVNGLGAGDAFAAAFGAGLLAGLSPGAAAERASAAGAIVASRLSCSTAMPRATEIDALLHGATGNVGAAEATTR